jgi:hypothetical protein
MKTLRADSICSMFTTIHFRIMSPLYKLKRLEHTLLQCHLILHYGRKEGRKWQDNGEDCIMRNITTCNLTKYY